MIARNTSIRRIKKELKELKELIETKDINTNVIAVETVNGNFLHLKGKVRGPPGTPYAGGNFILDIKVPETYPFDPVKIQFVTKIWHPNICSVTGRVFLIILDGGWAPSMSLRTTLLYLQMLLCEPEVEYSPQDTAVCKQYKENFEIFKLTAKYWAQFYAGAPGSIDKYKDKIRRMVKAGIKEEIALEALSARSWKRKEAIDLIFSDV